VSQVHLFVRRIRNTRPLQGWCAKVAHKLVAHKHLDHGAPCEHGHEQSAIYIERERSREQCNSYTGCYRKLMMQSENALRTTCQESLCTKHGCCDLLSASVEPCIDGAFQSSVVVVLSNLGSESDTLGSARSTDRAPWYQRLSIYDGYRSHRSNSECGPNEPRTCHWLQILYAMPRKKPKSFTKLYLPIVNYLST
jgi:hypothetical protein